MSLIKIQEFAVIAFKTAKAAKVKKGDTLAARLEKVRTYWVSFMVKRGWNEADAKVCIKDAEDMASLEMMAGAL